jgi:hypothetical protein
MPLGDYFLAPVPRAAAWDATPARAPATAAPPLLEPRSRSSWEVSARNSNVGLSTNSNVGGVQNGWEIISDATPDNDWIPNARYVGDGHHHAPQAIYEKLPLPKETRKVFRKGTTGRLPFARWHENDELHRDYSKAVKELMNRFMQEHNIKPEQMTPDQARSILKAIAESEEPRIRAYREMLRKMWMLYRLRSGGRGTE